MDVLLTADPSFRRTRWSRRIALGSIRLCLLIGACHFLTHSAGAGNVAQYERGVDPGIGFNLVSWGNFANGSTVWQNAVQAAYNAGFDEVSLSPIRFVETSSSAPSPAGSIAATSSRGPELSHIAAAATLAKSLGMRVTINPFVELKNNATYFQSATNSNSWRGFYDPTPSSGEWTRFWGDYQQYVVDVATMAQSVGADSMTIGTELRAITRNAGNNSQWTSLISAVNGAFGGTLGYASNWDNYNNANLTATIWDNPAIDFVGIDSYFPNLLANAQADASGTYPNLSFITAVENAWNNKLDGELLPFAAARHSGAGLPIEFTEVGYLPRNRTTVTPQGESQSLDANEQNMAFEGLMRALDGRQADGNFLATHIWQWDMQGSSGSAWNMNPSGGNQPSNQQTAQWLSSFAQGTNVDPGGSQPQPQATLLYSFETGLDGFYYPSFGGSVSTVAQSTGLGATEGTYSLSLTKSDDDWTWDARVAMSGAQLAALQQALANGAQDYTLDFDVTYSTTTLPASLTDMNLHVAIETNANGWNQVYPFANINARTTLTTTVSIPLSSFNLTSGITSANLHFGFDGAWPNGATATAYIDRVTLVDLHPDTGDFNGDGRVDGRDFLAWQRGLGASRTAAELAVWKQQFGGTAATANAGAVPEPASATLLVGAALLSWGLRNGRRVAGLPATDA